MPWFPTVVHQYQVLVYGTGFHSNSPVSGYARLAINLADSQSTDSGLHGNTFCIIEVDSSGFVGWDRVRSQLEMFIVTANENMDKQFLLCPIGTNCPGNSVDDFDELVELLDWPSNVVFLWRELIAEQNIERIVDVRRSQLITDIDRLTRDEILVDPPFFPEQELRKSVDWLECIKVLLACIDVSLRNHQGISVIPSDTELGPVVECVDRLRRFPRDIVIEESERYEVRINDLKRQIASVQVNKQRLEFLENELAYADEVKKLNSRTEKNRF